MRSLSDGGPDQREHGHGPGLCAWNYGQVEVIQIVVAAGMCWAREKMTPEWKVGPFMGKAQPAWRRVQECGVDRRVFVQVDLDLEAQGDLEVGSHRK